VDLRVSKTLFSKFFDLKHLILRISLEENLGEIWEKFGNPNFCAVKGRAMVWRTL
jgi:hypothetical protein